MRWFLNLKTAHKILLEFSLIGLLVAGIGVQNLLSLSHMQGNLTEIYQRGMLSMEAVQEARLNQAYAARTVRTAILSSDPSETRKQLKDLQKFTNLTEQNVLKYQGTTLLPEARAVTETAQSLIAEWKLRNSKIAAALERNNPRDALAIVNQTNTETLKLRAALMKMVELNQKVLAQSYQDGAVTFDYARKSMIAISVAGALLAVVLALTTARLIARPLAEVANILDIVAQGDLTPVLPVHSEDEVGRIAGSLNQALGSIRQALTGVNKSTHEMTLASRELASASLTLASGVQRHANSQVETSATLEELSTTVRQNADHAQQANDLAADAYRAAETGAQVVRSAVEAMEQVNHASSKIADIIGTVDDIAFQTNLLALNAAVEAARAGDLGRGFAVVAAEIRSLSQRSALAAKEIKGLIQDSLGKVGNASTLVHQSGKTLHEVLDSGKRVAQFATDIARASREQAAGIEQAASAMNEMDQVTQANSAQTEELSTTAESLAFGAHQLQKLVEQFKLS